jgi:predicted murein hydrolase (TIGR00659 family)
MELSYVFGHPLASLLVTLCSFSAAQGLQKRTGGHALLNPVVWSIALSVLYIYVTGIDYDTYMRGGQYIHFLLGPVTVALAVPLYKHIKDIKKDITAFLMTVLIACPIAGFSAWGLSVWANAPENIQMAVIPKSATTPIAIEIAEKINAVPSLTILFVILTGVSGSLMGPAFLKMISVKSERAQGLAIGIAAHGIGAARAFQISEKAGTYAVIGMCMMGIASGIILPLLVLAFIL